MITKQTMTAKNDTKEEEKEKEKEDVTVIKESKK